MTVEILYLAWNRKAFTIASFELMLANTDWSLVDRLVVYDDGSTDGTRSWLRANLARVPVATELRRTKFRSPPATMNDYVAQTDAETFVKVDSDIALPPDWLGESLAVMAAEPALELLGLQAGMGADPRDPNVNGQPRSWRPCSHIGGVGLMRTDAFREREPIFPQGRQGFTKWQHDLDPVRGWLSPDLRVVQLDLIPEEPWASLAHEYVGRGWARPWPKYEDRWWWEWIPEGLAQ